MRKWVVVVLLMLMPALALAQPRPQVHTLHSAEAGAAANGTVISTFGYPSVTVDNAIAAAWDGTMNYEANFPSIGWIAVQCRNQATNMVVTTTTGAASVMCNITGAQQFRARVSGRTVGTVTATAAIMSGGDSGLAAATITGTLVDDTAFGVEMDRVFPMGALADNAATDLVNEGDIGVPRMTLSRILLSNIADPTTDTHLARVTAAGNLGVDVGVFPDNEPFNVAQINGVTPLMGNGNTGTGSQRVTAVDNDPCQTSGRGKSSVVVAVTADAELVALSGSTIIYVCQFSVTVVGTNPTFRLVSGTGAVCATGLTGRTGTYAPLAGTYMQGGGGSATLLATAAGEALCMDVEGTVPSVQGVLSYIQQ